jgi:hypothetical protein
MLLFGQNDIGPRSPYQVVFVTVVLFTAAIINANIIGCVIVLAQSLNKKGAVFQEKMESTSETMKNLKIPRSIQEDVQSYLTFIYNTKDHQKEMDKFLKMLSPCLKRQVSNYIFYAVLIKNPIFEGKG